LTAKLDAKARLEALEEVFTALGHAARRQILLTVHFRSGAMTAGEIAGRFAHAWPTTTRHLRVLESAGLLTHEKVGRTRVYRVNRARLALITDWLAWFGDTNQNAKEKKMAGYSGTPLPRKLGIKEGHKVALIKAPERFDRTLGKVPKDAALQAGLAGKAPLDVIVFFVTRRVELERQLAAIRKRMAPAAALWVAWPKKASGVATDMTEDVVRDVALPTGLVVVDAPHG
jgi:DNA-binding transcriptional ArsR family regulator